MGEASEYEPALRLLSVNRFYWPDHSATSQLLTDLAVACSRAGHSVTVVTSRQIYDRPRAGLPARERQDGVRVHRVWTTRWGRDWLPGRAIDYAVFYFAALLALLRLARPGDVVLVKTDPPLLSVVAGLAARWRGAQLVAWQQDLFPEVASALGLRWAAGLSGRLLRSLRNRSLRRARATVVLNDRMAEHLRRAGVERGVRIIANWPDAAIQPVAPADNPFRATAGLEGRLVAGYSGNLGRAHLPSKIAELVAATGDIAGLTWVFVGGGAGLAQMRARLGSLGADRVQFHPYQPRERLSESLSAPDVHLISLDPACEGLIMPSKFYGVLAAGRPVLFLGDPDGSIAKEIRSHGLGLVLPADRPEAWHPLLADLLARPKRLAEMGARARARFEAAYRPEQALAAWIDQLTQAAAPEPSMQAKAPAGAPAAGWPGWAARLVFIVLALTVALLAFWPHLSIPDPPILSGQGDLLRHLVAFAALYVVGRLGWPAAGWLPAALAAAAVLLEVGQLLVPGRGAYLDDAGASLAGLVLGWLVWAAARRLGWPPHRAV